MHIAVGSRRRFHFTLCDEPSVLTVDGLMRSRDVVIFSIHIRRVEVSAAAYLQVRVAAARLRVVVF